MDGFTIQELQVWVANGYAGFGAAVFWLADYIETLSAEISMIWSKKITGTSVIFIFNRYMFLVYLVATLVGNLPGNGTDEQCNHLISFTYAIEAIALVTTTGLFALRVYAIYNSNKMILTISVAFILARFLLDILYIISVEGVSTAGSPVESLSSCAFVLAETNIPYEKVQLSSIVTAVTFDIFIFGLTVRKTFHHAIEMKRLGESSITQVIFRDGSIYFFSILVTAALTLTATLIGLFASNTGTTFFDIILPIFNVLPNVLISRLMLNLHHFSDAIDQENQPEGPHDTHYSGLQFATNSFLGNIGAPLDS